MRIYNTTRTGERAPLQRKVTLKTAPEIMSEYRSLADEELQKRCVGMIKYIAKGKVGLSSCDNYNPYYDKLKCAKKDSDMILCIMNYAIISVERSIIKMQHTQQMRTFNGILYWACIGGIATHYNKEVRSARHSISLDRRIDEYDSNSRELHDIVTDPVYEQSAGFERDIQDMIADILNCCKDDIDRYIVEERLNGKPYREITPQIGITQQACTKRMKKLLNRVHEFKYWC